VDSAQAMLALVAVAYVLRWLINRADGVPQDRAPWQYDRRTVLLFAAFFLASGLSYFKAFDISAWAKEMLKWVQMALLYVLVANERNERVRAILLGAVFAAVAMQAMLGLYQFVFKGGAPDHFAILNKRFYRAFGSMQQPNPFAGLMGMTWPVALSTALVLWFEHRPGLGLARWREALATQRWRRVLGVGALAACGLAVLALVASWSRGGWLAAGAAAFAFALVASRRPMLALGIIALGLALMYSSDLVAFLPGSLRTRLFGFVTDFSSIDVRAAVVTSDNFATIERLAHWQAAYGMIAEHFWLGVGLGNYEAAYDSYRTLAWSNALGHAHNYYLNIFAETGVLGLFTYLAFWGFVTARAARLAQQRNPRGWMALGIFASLMHIHVHHMVDNLFVSNLWLFMGVYLGLLENTTPPAPAPQPVVTS
jgi:O-antigen ligase